MSARGGISSGYQFFTASVNDAEKMPQLHRKQIEGMNSSSYLLYTVYKNLGTAKLVNKSNIIFLDSEFDIFNFFSSENTLQAVSSKFKNQNKSSQVFPKLKSQPHTGYDQWWDQLGHHQSSAGWIGPKHNPGRVVSMS